MALTLVMMKETNGKSLIEFLTDRAARDMVSFHMPGHKGIRFYDKLGYDSLLSNLVPLDITEIKGADNLFQPETVIREVMNRYKALYESRETFLSVGGSSAGLIASILAAVQVKGEDSYVVMARNCHKSVYNGVKLSKAEPLYIYPEIISDLEIAGSISPIKVEEILRESKEQKRKIACLVITSPNYYGICSPVKEISEICREYDVPLIVDQAHGAHLKFMSKVGDVPPPAEEQGADIVVNSTHKTLASFTQTAIINVMGDKIPVEVLGDKLQVIESSSPSYILMASLELNARILEEKGSILLKEWWDNLDYFYNKAREIPDLKCRVHPLQDPTKILMDLRGRGYRGDEFGDALEDLGIEIELWDNNLVMAMTGIGNEREDFHKLIRALETIPEKSLGNKKLSKIGDEEKIINDLVGRRASASIIPYPPGIPLVAEGEVIEEEDLRKALDLRRRGAKVIGLNLDI